MRKASHFMFAFLTVAVLFGCGRFSGKKAEMEKIVFPTGLERIDGTGAHPDLSVPAIRLMVFIDSTECSSCRLNNLYKYSSFSSMSEIYPGFETIVLIQPNSETAGSIDKDLAHRKLPFDVLIDRDASFLKVNPSVPATGRNQHVFLTGSDGVPLFVGDPLSSAGRDRQIRNLLYSIYERK